MSTDLELRHLRALLAVDREGGVGRAARALGVSQSTLSEHLLGLERVLGVGLTVRRRGQEVMLSQAGQAWLPYAKRILKEVDGALAAAAGSQGRTLRVGAAESLGSFVLPEALRALRTRWADVAVQVSNGLCDELRSGVKADALDLALTLNADTSPDGDLAVTRLASARLVLLAAPEHGLDARGPVGRAALTGRTVLTPDPEGEFRRSLERYLGGVAKVSLISAGTIGGVKAGVLVGQGLGVLPAYAVRAELARGDLHEVALAESLPNMAIEAAVLKAATPAPALRNLLELLAEQLATLAP